MSLRGLPSGRSNIITAVAGRRDLIVVGTVGTAVISTQIRHFDDNRAPGLTPRAFWENVAREGLETASTDDGIGQRVIEKPDRNEAARMGGSFRRATGVARLGADGRDFNEGRCEAP